MHAVNLKKKKLRADTFNQEVVSSSLIGRGLAKMAEKVKQTRSVRFNTAYYLAINERPSSGFGDLLTLQKKNREETSDMYHNEGCANFIDTTGTSICQKLLEDITKCNYFTLLMDGKY